MRERTYAMALYCFRSLNETEPEVLQQHMGANPRDLIEGGLIRRTYSMGLSRSEGPNIQGATLWGGE